MKDMFTFLGDPGIGMSVVGFLGIVLSFAQLYQGSRSQNTRPASGCLAALSICAVIAILAVIGTFLIKFYILPVLVLPVVNWLAYDGQSFGWICFLLMLFMLFALTLVFVRKGQKNRVKEDNGEY